MKRQLTPYIYSFFLCVFSYGLNAQKNAQFSLKIISLDSSENKHLKNLKFKKNFISKIELQKTRDRVINTLKEEGFYTLIIDSVSSSKNTRITYVNLGEKVEKAFVNIQDQDKHFFSSNEYNIENDQIVLKPKELPAFLTSINKALINNGESFAKVQLTKIKINKLSLYATLKIVHSKKRKINSFIIKGYEHFPKKFIRHYLNLTKELIINEKNLSEISRKINLLKFASEIKKPEVLFSKDSSLLYIYLKKKKANSFDGLINFSSEDGKINFKGYLDVSLLNIFNSGEEIKVNWKNNGNDKQDFLLKTKVPYLFNNKITTEVDFNIYRQDSSFVNLKSQLALNYPVNNKVNLGVIYQYENSSINQQLNTFSDFTKQSIGFQFHYIPYQYKALNFDLSFLIGKRNSNNQSINQLQIRFQTSNVFTLNNRLKLFLKNTTGYIKSEDYFKNELFRVGGQNSMRGFNEQSLITPKFSFINSEFRLHTKANSYLYSIQDFGIFNINNASKNLYSLGLGYHISNTQNSTDINFVIGNPTSNLKDLKHSILSIKVLTFF